MLSATAAFGLEAVVKRELAALGFTPAASQDGRVDFSATPRDIAKVNLRLRSADRVNLIAAQFTAVTFEELYQGVKAVDWENLLPEDANFTINGKSVKSALHAVPACQSVTEKAIVERLKTRYPIDRFLKTGAAYKITTAILRDAVTITVDASGDGLHKRGYRPAHNAAPIKETLANALIDLSFWKPGRVLFDPFCGSGTICVEAAMRAKNIAPGLRRHFAAEGWTNLISEEIWREERAAARAEIKPAESGLIFGSDKDPDAIETAKHNAKRAGVDDIITFVVQDASEARLPAERGVLITNPPYAERLGTLKEVESLYRRLGTLTKDDKLWPTYVITSDEWFEKCYGKKADKKRKLFNGAIKADYYQYF